MIQFQLCCHCRSPYLQLCGGYFQSFAAEHLLFGTLGSYTLLVKLKPVVHLDNGQGKTSRFAYIERGWAPSLASGWIYVSHLEFYFCRDRTVFCFQSCWQGFSPPYHFAQCSITNDFIFSFLNSKFSISGFHLDSTYCFLLYFTDFPLSIYILVFLGWPVQPNVLDFKFLFLYLSQFIKVC